MPLHAEHIGAARPRAHRFDQTVVRGRLDRKSRAEPRDALFVHRIDRHPPPTGRLREQPVGVELDIVAMPEHLLITAIPRPAVMPFPARRDRQRAAEQHVDLLQPAANAEHRLARLDHRRRHRERHRVTVGIAMLSGGKRRAAIVFGRDVRARSRQQQPVEQRRECRDAGLVGHRGNKDHRGFGKARQGRDEARRHRLDRAAERLVAAQHADHRARRGGGGARRSHALAARWSTSRRSSPAA